MGRMFSTPKRSTKQVSGEFIKQLRKRTAPSKKWLGKAGAMNRDMQRGAMKKASDRRDKSPAGTAPKYHKEYNSLRSSIKYEIIGDYVYIGSVNKKQKTHSPFVGRTHEFGGVRLYGMPTVVPHADKKTRAKRKFGRKRRHLSSASKAKNRASRIALRKKRGKPKIKMVSKTAMYKARPYAMPTIAKMKGNPTLILSYSDEVRKGLKGMTKIFK